MPSAAGWKGVLSVLAVLTTLAAHSSAQAASPARPDPYAAGVQDEVMMQNLTCEDIEIFLAKRWDDPMIVPATAIINQPQHSKETSDTLFGPTLTRLILTASRYPAADHPPNPDPSELPPDDPVIGLRSQNSCTVIVPRSAAADVNACDGRSNATSPPGLGMQTVIAPPKIFPGELKLLGMFDHAAEYKNCRR
ncbi:MAG: hypothetical protein JWM33_820 [Caulobacteraceae bacterium]|nr:hypothetical protein [Caulobacteraceae bacterium]